VDFQALLEREVPELRGKFGPRYSREVACPFCGGRTRFRYREADDVHGQARVFCSYCAPRGLTAVAFVMRLHHLDYRQACAYLASKALITDAPRPVPPRHVEPLDSEIALRHHRTAVPWREYFYGRGITDALIDEYLLGYHATWQRFSIPCFVTDRATGVKQLWAVQYRIRPEVERYLKANGERVRKYVSEPGGHNHQLFNADFVDQPLPFVLVLEGPLDCISLRRFGYPAVAAFHGNNTARAWDTQWNGYLKRAASVLVIPDNDASGIGEVIARSKANDIPRSRIHRLPAGVKDVGELIQPLLRDGDASVIRHLHDWLGLPPVCGETN
jgi:DNA primase